MEHVPDRVIEEFKVTDNLRSARIRFVNGVFTDCVYSMTNPYDYKDWMFLMQVATRIKDIKDSKEGRT